MVPVTNMLLNRYINQFNHLPPPFYEDTLNERADIMRTFPGIHSKQSVQTLRVFGGVLLVENSSPELLPSALLVPWIWLILINMSIGILYSNLSCLCPLHVDIK